MKTIATVGGLGNSPVAPGTLGSAVGLVIAWVLSGSMLYQSIGCLAVIVLALWSSGPTARSMNDPDPQSVIIDEVAGMMVAVVALPATWPVYGIGFLLFRLLDILKPPPIKQIQRLPGSWGIVLDDLAAGLAANLILRLLPHSLL
ncbi:MAG: phosphatidylglycerophosphatase A [Candidatus Omnitrophica bacterium]|nr:phosphatidylglycerophosphatase A [Candidatus Omnitrophota bacterium]